MPGRIDLHCHLLPGVDDGPTSEAEALELARALVADGVGTAALTPHRTARRRTSPITVASGAARLRELLALERIPLEVVTGAEVAVEALLDMDEDEVEAHRFGGRGALLVELPLREVAGDPAWPVRDLLARGVPVLLAHPERIPFLRSRPDALRELLDLGAHAQVTAGALLGDFGPRTQGAALDLLDAGLVDVIASDAHHAVDRPPRLEAARALLADVRPDLNFDALAVHTPSVLIPPADGAR